MDRREKMHGRMGVVVAATLIACAGMPVSALAQSDGVAVAEGQAGVSAAKEPVRIRFNFDGAPFDQVLDFFARETGLPVIREAAVPAGNLKFISGRDFSLGEALEVYNYSLRAHGVRLVHEGDFLYLRSLAGAASDARAVSPEELAAIASRDPSEYVTTYIPLNNALAERVVEQIKPLIREPGLAQAIDRQNMLLLVETAAQCKRIFEIITQIDQVRPADIGFEVYPLRYTTADAIVATIKGIVPERDEIMVVDKNGNARNIEDVSKPPLKLSADARINAVVAVGPTSRLPVVKELVALLDTADGSAEGASTGPQMKAFELSGVTAEDAATQVSALFRAIPEARRPTVQALADVSRVMVVGSPSQLEQARALLDVIDPRIEGLARQDRSARVVHLTHIEPDRAMQIAQRLLTPRQVKMLSFAPSSDGRSLIVAGPALDVDALEQLIAGIDAKPDLAQHVRVVRLSKGPVSEVVARASELDNMTTEAQRDAVKAIVDEESRSVTLVGSASALARFEDRLRAAEQSVVIETETRMFTLKRVRATELAGQLSRLLVPMLTPEDGSVLVPPSIDPLDDLKTLVVRAQPEQFSTIEGLIAQLDQEKPGERQFQVMSLSGPYAEQSVQRAMELYKAQTQGLPESEAGEISFEIDRRAGKLLLTGRSAGLVLFSGLLTQVQQLVPPMRTTRVVDIEFEKASELVAPLREFLAGADSIDPMREVPEPTMSVIERTNSLMITAEEAQHQLIGDYLKRLDRLEPGDLPPLRLIQLRTADALNIAAMLTQQYSQRSTAERMARPVEIRADGNTNTLIVAAHADLFGDIKAFVDELNKEESDQPERLTFLFPLKVAKAVDVATAMDKLYPQPPMPADRLGRPMPWLQEKKEVTVSADPSSNSLIIDAPADRRASLEELAEKLDRVEVPPVAELRTYHVVGADLNSVARMLEGLSRNGSLSSAAQPGRPKVQVVIETEPKSSTLIVAGDEVTFEKVEQVLKSLTAVPVDKALRIVPIANAQATDVRARALQIYDSQTAQIPGAGKVDVTIDSSTNSLEVVADIEAMARFVQILDELQRQIGPAREVRMVQLKLAQVSEVIGFLRELVGASESLKVAGGPTPVFEPIEATNSIMIAAQPAQFAIIEQLIRSLDNQQVADRPPMRILRLRSTDAANLALVLQRSYEQRPTDERAKQPVDVQADAATNTLIVSAHSDVMPEIEAIVRELNDAQSFDLGERQIRIFPLRVARAEELARTIDEMYPPPPMPRDARGIPRPDLQGPKEIFVRADRATNSLIVDAPSERLAGFEQVVKQLDQTKLAENVELRTYRIARADLGAVQTTLRGLAENGALTNAAQAPITISAEPASRTVVVSGPSEIFERVEAVLREVDGEIAHPSTSMRLYSLKHVRAERVQSVLRQILSARLREQQRAEGALAVPIEELLEVAADPGSNTLIISAPESLQEAAEQLIAVLDTEAAASGRSTIRVVPLTYADAAQLAQTLNQALPSMNLPGGEVVQILPTASSNAILIAGTEADLKRIEGLIEPLDRQPFDPEKATVETFPLKYAEATKIATTVERLLVDQQQTDPRILALQMRSRDFRYVEPAKIRVEAETRTNSLIVSGPTVTIQLAKSMIERLDQPTELSGRRAVTFTPANGDASFLAESVSRVLAATRPAGRYPLEVIAEGASGSVLVIGSDDEIADALRRLADLDDRSPAMPMVEVRSFELANTGAGSAATAARALLSDETRWPEALVRARRVGLRVPSVSVDADLERNRLLVSAPSLLMPLAEQLVASLDQPRQSGAVDVRVFQLKKGNAASVATAMRDALSASLSPGEKAPAVTAEPSSNSVVIAASTERLERAAAMIASMDESVEPDGVGVRTVYLKHAKAEVLAPLVQQIIAKEDPLAGVDMWSRGFLMRELSRGGMSFDDVPVKVVAERRLNALIISAPAAMLSLAEQVIEGLDVDRGPGGTNGDRIIRVIVLQNADVTELSASVADLFDSDETGEVAPSVRVDAQSNALIVRGSSTQISTIEALVKELDAATLTSSRQLRLISVDRSRADAQMMARTLQRMLEQQQGIKVEIISAEELLERGRKQGPGAGALPAGRTWQEQTAGLIAATALGAIQAVAAAGEQVDTDEEPALVIAVDPVTNTLMVIGSPRLTDRVAGLVEQLESQMPADPTAVRIVSLPDLVDARQVADIVSQTVQQVGISSSTNPGGFTGRVAIRPDLTGSAVIVWANEKDFESVAEIIAGVSRLTDSVSVMVKVYPLSNVLARQAVTSVRDLFSAAPRGRQAQQIRDLTMLDPSGREVRASINPDRISVISDPSDTMLIVAAPREAFDLVDRFVAMLDQSPVMDRLGIRRYALVNARATDLSRTLQTLFDAQRTGAGRTATEMPRAMFVADDRTNSLLVTASSEQHDEVSRLLTTTDVTLGDVDTELAIIPLRNSSPAAVSRIVDQVVIGRDPGRRERIQISAEESSRLFVVRAPKEEMEQVRALVEQVDKIEVGTFPIRSIKLATANAVEVAQQLQQFFRERGTIGSARGPRSGAAAIIGEERSGTLIVSASDDDFAQIESLVQMFDVPAAGRKLQTRIVNLKNARVSDISGTLRNLGWALQEERFGGFWGGGRRSASTSDTIIIEVNERTNSVIVMGQGETLDTIMAVVAELDQPLSNQTKPEVRAVKAQGADLNALARMIEQSTATPGWREWFGRDPDRVVVQADRERSMLILVGDKARVDLAEGYIKQIAEAAVESDREIRSIRLEHAEASRAATSLSRFFAERARSQGVDQSGVTIIGSNEGNVLLVSARAEDLTVLNDLIAQIDQPELGEGRTIEVFSLRHIAPDEAATTLREMFPTSRADERVIATAQPSRSSLIVSAPVQQMDRVKALLSEIDALPAAESTRIATVQLDHARAADVASALRSALPIGVRLQITANERLNALMLTGSDEAISLVRDQIASLDTPTTTSPSQFRRFEIKHQSVSDLAFTLRAMMRGRPRGVGVPEPNFDPLFDDNAMAVTASADDMPFIEEIIREIDTPRGSTRKTRFIKLQYAAAESAAEALKMFYGRLAPEAASPAQRDVTILRDNATNSLVISGDESVWEGIEGLLAQLDTAEYDTSQQLVVISLKHADAQSVARAINEGLRAPLEEQLRREQLRLREENRRTGGREEPTFEPAVLVSSEGTPTVSAEVQTNSLIVFAGRKDIDRIRAIVEQLDVPDFLRMASARVIPLTSGRASVIAGSLRQAFASRGERAGSPREVVIIGDDASNTLIVRADDEQFSEILSLTQEIVSQVSGSQATPRVLRVSNVPAVRLRETLLATFSPLAQQRNEPLSISVDRGSNSLIVAASDEMHKQLQELTTELDGVQPGDGGPGLHPATGVNMLGQTVLVIDIEHNAPAEVIRMLEQLGVTRPQPSDRPGLVSEPVVLMAMTTRRAIAVLGTQADCVIVATLVRSVDAKPGEATQDLAVIRLRMADAAAVVQSLSRILDSAQQAPTSAPALALREQIRRLKMTRDRFDEGPIELDLSVPIRLIPDATTNSIFVGSTVANVAAIRELVGLLDTMPMGESVVVRIFPLENSSARTLKPLIEELFRESDRLRRLPGTTRVGLPNTAIGQALAGEIVVAVDERTNSLIVGGREEAVALVEVLIRDLDEDNAAKGWLEARILPLQYADAVTLAQKIDQVLVRGIGSTPESVGLQRQAGRLRLVLRDGGQDHSTTSDIFAPMTDLVVTPEETLNALIVVGTPTNINVVRELASMLDVELAASKNALQVIPMQFAAAERVAGIVTDVFRQRETLPTFRVEDRVVISVDGRTNSLVVSTSPRSFELLHSLIETLDKEESRYAVGLHVVYVPQADVRQLAPKLQRLMRERIEATRRSGDIQSAQDVFSIEAEPATSSLIVAASDENLVLVRDFIEMLTRGGLEVTQSEKMEVIPLESLGRANEIAAAVNSLYVQRENERRGDRAVTVVASERQNALIVMGNESDMLAVRAIVARLDRTRVENVVDYKRIVLNSASAREVVTLVQDALAGRSIRGSSGGSQQATILRVFKDQIEQSVAEATIDGNIRDQITLTPDSRTNSIMITAPTEVMNLITRIIEDLDLDRRGDRVIETFVLVNADAQAMAVLLGELFNLRQLGDSLVLIPSRAGVEQEEAPGRFTPVPDVRQELSITVDRRTNTLLVSGTREYLDEVRQVVENLDAIQALEREQRVFNLRNAQAAEIQTTLRGYFESEAERRRLTLGPQRAESFMRQLEQEVTVVGDIKSNKLVISASPRYIEAVAKIVEELDASPPQVMIQVLLAEITLDNSDSWGMDINIGGVVATSKIGGDGYVFEALAGGAGVATSLGVPNFSVASTDFTLLLRALEEQGKLEVLSRPHVTVNNNEDALIQVGENIAIVTGVQRDNFTGGTTANVERENVGIILNVRPSISSDGFVRMNIAPEISQLSARTVQIDANFNAPIITQRLVDTVVTVKNGQTVVIGGLIQTIEENRKTKVKGLGNLPVIGGLFRTSENSKVKTELLVILTPYVIPGDSPAAELRQRDLTNQKIFGLENPEKVLKALGHEDGLPSVTGLGGPVALPEPLDPERAKEWSEWFKFDEDEKGTKND